MSREHRTDGMTPAKNAWVDSVAFQGHSRSKAVHSVCPCQSWLFFLLASPPGLTPLLTPFPTSCPIKILPVSHKAFLDFPHLFIITISFETSWHSSLNICRSNAWYRSNDSPTRCSPWGQGWNVTMFFFCWSLASYAVYVLSNGVFKWRDFQNYSKTTMLRNIYSIIM